jgi:hypothetical protein
MGVIREDPLEAAWAPQQRPQLHATPAAAALHSGEARQVSERAVLEADSPGQLAASSGGSAGTAAQRQAQVAVGVLPVENATEEAAAGSSTSQRQQQQQSLDQTAHDPTSISSSSSHSLGGAPEGRVDEMLSRLQALPWRRVDVCFGATLLPMLSHQHIQASRGWRAVGPLAVRSSSALLCLPVFTNVQVKSTNSTLVLMCTHVVPLALPAGAAALDELAWKGGNQAPGVAAASHGGITAAGAACAARTACAASVTAASAAATCRGQHRTSVAD